MRLVIAVAAAVAVAAGAVPLAAQDLPRTPWGDPDLQGIWTNTTITPLQRPEELAGQATLSAEERAARDAERERNADRPPPPGQTGAYNNFWMERGVLSERTSLVVDPSDGLLPPLTPPAAARAGAIHAVRYSDRRDWVTDFHLYDRCITRGLPGGMTTYRSPWTAAMPMTASAGPLFEYACHEGNYALRNMLSGARADEAAAAAAAK